MDNKIIIAVLGTKYSVRRNLNKRTDKIFKYKHHAVVYARGLPNVKHIFIYKKDGTLGEVLQNVQN